MTTHGPPMLRYRSKMGDETAMKTMRGFLSEGGNLRQTWDIATKLDVLRKIEPFLQSPKPAARLTEAHGMTKNAGRGSPEEISARIESSQCQNPTRSTTTTVTAAPIFGRFA